jgi:VIT1/CCC1 family predicted Fe2+/Mn2+ transporter
VRWSRPDRALFGAWRERAPDSILEVNDGIVSAAGIAEGFASVGASLPTLLFAGTALILAGGLAAAGASYSEVRTEWEMDRALVDAERACILADPEAELAELTAIYEAKGLDPQLAQQVARALTDRDPVAAHTDAELRLAALGPTSRARPDRVVRGLVDGAAGHSAGAPQCAARCRDDGDRRPGWQGGRTLTSYQPG